MQFCELCDSDISFIYRTANVINVDLLARSLI